MKVARHEMHGKPTDTIRPVGNGVICIGVACLLVGTVRYARPPIIPYPYGTGFWMPVFQAFHAWLPSFCPSGTETLAMVIHLSTALGARMSLLAGRTKNAAPRQFGDGGSKPVRDLIIVDLSRDHAEY